MQTVVCLINWIIFKRITNPIMTTRTSIRTRKAPIRFKDEAFVPGANNKFTVGRMVDAGHSAAMEHDAAHVGDFQEEDRDFVVEEVAEDESDGPLGSGSESEEEWEGEESESEEEWEGEESESEEEECGYWESDSHPLPENVFTYNLQDGIWSYYSYVKKINGEYIATLSEWLDECPDNIYNDDEWLGNMVGKLTDVVLPENRQADYLSGKFATEKGWRNVQLPMGVADDDEE